MHEKHPWLLGTHVITVGSPPGCQSQQGKCDICLAWSCKCLWIHSPSTDHVRLEEISCSRQVDQDSRKLLFWALEQVFLWVSSIWLASASKGNLHGMHNIHHTVSVSHQCCHWIHPSWRSVWVSNSQWSWDATCPCLHGWHESDDIFNTTNPNLVGPQLCSTEVGENGFSPRQVKIYCGSSWIRGGRSSLLYSRCNRNGCLYSIHSW